MSSFTFPCDPVQFAVLNSSLVNLTANIFKAALCRSLVLSRTVETLSRLEGVKTFSVGKSAVGTEDDDEKLEFVDLITPAAYCGTNENIILAFNLSSLV